MIPIKDYVVLFKKYENLSIFTLKIDWFRN